MQIALPRLLAAPDVAVKQPRSQAERLWLIGGGIVAFVLCLIGYFFFISPQRSDTASVDSQVSQANQQIAQLRAHLGVLRSQYRNLPKFENELTQARLAMPASSDTAQFVRSLQALGATTHTEVTALTVSPPAPVTVAPAAASTAGTPAATGTTAATTPAPGGSAAAPAPAAYSMAISLSVSGSPAALNNFLDQLQAVQPRAVLISQIAESAAAPKSGGGASQPQSTTLQISMQAFVAPPTAAATASVTPTK